MGSCVYNTGPSCPAQGSLQKSPIHFALPTHCTLAGPILLHQITLPQVFSNCVFTRLSHKNTTRT